MMRISGELVTEVQLGLGCLVLLFRWMNGPQELPPKACYKSVSRANRALLSHSIRTQSRFGRLGLVVCSLSRSAQSRSLGGRERLPLGSRRRARHGCCRVARRGAPASRFQRVYHKNRFSESLRSRGYGRN